MLSQYRKPQAGDTLASIETNLGTMTFLLFPEVAPRAVESFTELVQEGYYEGVIFHRVIKDFMIQGGDPTGTGRGGESTWGEPFEDEFDPFYRCFYGSLCMANAGPDTNGSQFFVVQNKEVPADIIAQMESLGEKYGYYPDVIEAYKENGGCYWLDFKHTVFGHIQSGQEVLEKIAGVKTGFGDKPAQEVVMQKVTIETLA